MSEQGKAKEQTEAPPPRRGKHRPIALLAGLGPVEREQIARWLDAERESAEYAMQQSAELINSGQDWPGAYNQMQYWRVQIAILRAMAWNVRVSTGGPLGDEPKRRRKQKPQT